jgi:hypothetical protein
MGVGKILSGGYGCGGQYPMGLYPLPSLSSTGRATPLFFFSSSPVTRKAHLGPSLPVEPPTAAQHLSPSPSRQQVGPTVGVVPYLRSPPFPHHGHAPTSPPSARTLPLPFLEPPSKRRCTHTPAPPRLLSCNPPPTLASPPQSIHGRRSTGARPHRLSAPSPAPLGPIKGRARAPLQPAPPLRPLLMRRRRHEEARRSSTAGIDLLVLRLSIIKVPP